MKTTNKSISIGISGMDKKDHCNFVLGVTGSFDTWDRYWSDRCSRSAIFPIIDSILVREKIL